MSLMKGFKRLFRWPSPDIRRDVDDELQLHIEMKTRDLIDAGVDPLAARVEARRRFGNLRSIRRRCTRVQSGHARITARREFVDGLWQDLRIGARTLRKSPGFAVVVVLTLALGIGANASIFSFVNAYLLRPLPGITDPDRLVELGRTQEGRGFDAFSYREFTDYRDRNRVFSGVMAYRSVVLDLGGAGETRRVRGALVSSNYFVVLGTHTALGRTFSIDEEQPPGAHPVAVISHSLWQGRFGADADILGTALTLNGRSFIVVGVAAEGFRGHEAWDTWDIWVPLSMFREASPEALASLGDLFTWLTLVGRLEPGISLALAQTEMNTLARRLEQVHPDENRGAGVALASDITLPTGWRTDARNLLALLMAVVGLVLLVVCANLSNLVLARTTGRRGEIAIRLALGAGRARVLRPLLSENILLALLGGAVGLVLAVWSADLLAVWAFGEEEFDRVSLSLDGRVLAFTLLVTIVCGMAVSLASALRVSGLDMAAAMKGRVNATIDRSNLRNLLVISQLSVSLVLLTGAGALIETLRSSQTPFSVFEPDNLLLVSVWPSHQGYGDTRARIFYRVLQERVEGLPGVRSASLARGGMPIDQSFFRERVTGEDLEGATGVSWIDAHYSVVAPKYFQTLGVVLVAGRDLTPEDREGAPPVVIVNETLAHRLWPGEDPLGKRIRISNERSLREVVGLATDRPSQAGAGAHPFLYYPLFQPHPWARSASTLHIRTTGDPMGVLPAVQREVQDLDANLPIFEPRTMSKEISDTLEDQRIASAVIGISGLLALVLAAAGLYGLMSYAVSERTREIGIRVALGAQRSDVLGQVVKQGMKMALLGTGIGLLATLALTRVLSNLMDGVNDMNPAVFVGVSLVLTGVAFVASYLPARRAAQVDPMLALRSE
ncbi:MAG: ABC transporter permease [Gemmatimonadetes bacterium]|nr:ABC transporter permease [Gemmatimonadota bacterium]